MTPEKEEDINKQQEEKEKKRIGYLIIPSFLAYRLLKKRLYELTKLYVIPANKIIKQMVEDNAPINLILERITSLSTTIESQFELNARGVIKKWSLTIDASNKKSIEKSISKAVGNKIVLGANSKAIRTVMETFEETTIQLIKSIPAKNLNQVADAVMKNYLGVKLPGGVSLGQRISDIGKITLRRGNFIARDQTASLNGLIAKQRCLDAGIYFYIWITMGDERVVGNPEGLYPKGNIAHGNHYKRNNKKFAWLDSPYDGTPGIPINCRCVAKPYVNIETLVI